MTPIIYVLPGRTKSSPRFCLCHGLRLMQGKLKHLKANGLAFPTGFCYYYYIFDY